MKNYYKVFFLFFMFGLLVYFNSFNNKFLIDDFAFLQNPVMNNPKFILSQWDPYREQVRGVLDIQEIQIYYRPMTHMLYDFCYTVFRNNFWQYHLFNLCLFVLASFLIYLLFGRISGNYNLAFWAGLFYLIHPINGIIVNYVSASVFAFQVIFMLSTILLLWESLERKNNRPLYFLSLCFAFFSLFWHESGVMTPFYICAVVILFRNDSFIKKVFYLLPYFLIVFLYVIFRFYFLSFNEIILKQIPILHMNGWEYLASLFRVLSWYITRLFYPKGIVMAWAIPILHDHIALNVLGAFLLPILFILFFIKFTKEKVCQLALVWLVIGFAPACLAVFRIPDSGALIEPHWFVFSSIGFFILVAYFCLILLDQMKKTGLILLFIIFFAWGSVSHANNQLWADEKTYGLYWSELVPHLRSPYFYLADAFQRAGDLKESRKYYNMALSGQMSDIYVFNNIGMLDEDEGNLKEAELDYKKVLKIHPHAATANDNLGALYLQEGKWKQARDSFLQALAYDPFLLPARRGLAIISLRNSAYRQAIDLCLLNLNIDNNDASTMYVLINIYIQKKDFTNVRRYIHRILNLETDPRILTTLGIVVAQDNDPQLAIDCFMKAIHLAPDYKDAYFATGTLFANLGKFEEAIHIWKLGSAIDPSDKRFKNSIVKAVSLKLK